jgi:hypothetical protein
VLGAASLADLADVVPKEDKEVAIPTTNVPSPRNTTAFFRLLFICIIEGLKKGKGGWDIS